MISKNSRSSTTCRDKFTLELKMINKIQLHYRITDIYRITGWIATPYHRFSQEAGQQAEAVPPPCWKGKHSRTQMGEDKPVQSFLKVLFELGIFNTFFYLTLKSFQTSIKISRIQKNLNILHPDSPFINVLPCKLHSSLSQPAYPAFLSVS